MGDPPFEGARCFDCTCHVGVCARQTRKTGTLAIIIGDPTLIRDRNQRTSIREVHKRKQHGVGLACWLLMLSHLQRLSRGQMRAADVTTDPLRLPFWERHALRVSCETWLLRHWATGPLGPMPVSVASRQGIPDQKTRGLGGGRGLKSTARRVCNVVDSPVGASFGTYGVLRRTLRNRLGTE